MEESEAHNFCKPDKVRNGLYISGADAAANRIALKKEGVSHILSLTGCAAPYPQVFFVFTVGLGRFPSRSLRHACRLFCLLRSQDFTYLVLQHVQDCSTQDLLCHLPRCVEFIERALKEGTGVLVHWYALSFRATLSSSSLPHRKTLGACTTLDCHTRAFSLVSHFCAHL